MRLCGQTPTLARKVCTDDDFVDDLTHQLFRELLSFMIENPATITRAIRLTFIGKYIERIADHATNIAELVSTWSKVKSSAIRRRQYFPTMKAEGCTLALSLLSAAGFSPK